MTPVQVGIIGCGIISESYLKGAVGSKLVQIKAVADMKPEAAQARASAYGMKAVSIEELLADPEIEIVLNLTFPQAHFEVSKQILAAGKHVYTEKPFSGTFAQAKELNELAQKAGLRIGGAPDTFLGGSHQAARALVDSGALGPIVGGTSSWLTRSSAHRHAKPLFLLFKKGGGPLLDMGQYYITQLVNLLGPVRRVTAVVSNPIPRRPVTAGPLAGQTIDIEVPTSINGVLDFEGGANIAVTLSWDAHVHGRIPCELYGEFGTLRLPDPNLFGGEVTHTEANGPFQVLDYSDRPFGAVNLGPEDRMANLADYRFVGVIDMAAALRDGRPHRTSEQLCLHVMEVLEGFERSSAEGRHIEMTTRCERPEPVPKGKGEEALLASR